MAGEVFIARQDTLEVVKSSTDMIKQDTNFIKEQFPISGGTDWSKYNSIFSKYDTYQNINGISELEILNIQGKGYLTKFSIGYEEGSGSENTEVIVTMDDKVILNSKLKYNSSNKRTVFLNGSFTNNTPSSINFPQPLFFQKSISIKLKNVKNYRLGYEYGGVIQA